MIQAQTVIDAAWQSTICTRKGKICKGFLYFFIFARDIRYSYICIHVMYVCNDIYVYIYIHISVHVYSIYLI